VRQIDIYRMVTLHKCRHMVQMLMFHRVAYEVVILHLSWMWSLIVASWWKNATCRSRVNLSTTTTAMRKSTKRARDRLNNIDEDNVDIG